MADIYKDLFEAYQTVYVPQEVEEATAMAKRGLDEPAIRQKIAKSTGGGEAADRATKLADKQVFKGSGSARDNLARKQRGDFRNTTSSNPGLHVGQHKATNAADKAKQAARGAQRSALTPNEKKKLNMGDETPDVFDLVLEFLQAEGYAETLEEAEWLMANVIDEEAIDIILGEAIGDVINTNTPYGKHRTVVTPIGTRSTLNGRDLPTQRQRDPKAIVSPKRDSKEQPRVKKDSRLEAVEYVGEAQAARENPEKYEREQSKKTAPVRGERTPMPPRGDKRREDFEKWYAANVR